MKFLWLAHVAGASACYAGYFMVRNPAKKLDNLDVRFVCSFISKKFHSREKRV